MRLALFICLLLGSTLAFAQKNKDASVLRTDFDASLYEEQLRLTELMYWAQFGDSTFERNDANYLFIRGLVRALRTEGAFDFPFDSLRYISKLYTPDRKYRIFTWQVKQEFGTYRHFGCILSNDQASPILPLIDQSDVYIGRDDTILTNKTWYGAAYFQIVPETIKIKGITYYTLIGYDPHEPFSQRKMIDFLWFDKEGIPHFGAPLLETPAGTKHRFYIEYASDVMVQLRYDLDAKKIVYDHLIPRNNENAGLGFDDVPDGSFNAFILKKKKWRFEDNTDIRLQYSSPEPEKKPSSTPKKPQSGLLPPAD